MVSPQLFDTDDDQRITQGEFSSLLRCSLGVADLDISKLFSEVDVDKSGCISYGESTPPPQSAAFR
uniref:EF-hand domain-containing protein n=1 Tax=Anguilla anguilla TaxID=7936 RepID=A0A0E9VII6_ANGAN